MKADTFDRNKVNAIIDNILLYVELEGDGVFSTFTQNEKEEMWRFLQSLR